MNPLYRAYKQLACLVIIVICLSGCDVFTGKKSQGKKAPASQKQSVKKDPSKDPSGDAKKNIDVNEGENKYGFFKASDINKPKTLPSLTEEQVLSELNTNAAFVNDQYDADEDADEGCYSKLISAIKIKALNQHTVIVRSSIDFAECSEKDMTFIGTMQIYIYIMCEKTDLSSYDEKPYDSLFAKKLVDLCDNQKASIMMQVKSELKSDIEDFVSNSNSYDSLMTDETKPCQVEIRNGKMRRENGCKQTSYQKFSSNAEDSDASETYLQLEFVGIEGTKESKYYDQGTIKLVLNDWQGTVSYRGGDLQPEFVVTRKKDKLTGTIDYQLPESTSSNN